MRRREVLVLLGAVTAFPLAGHAQREAYRFGILEALPAAQNTANLSAFRNGLQAGGYIEGRNLTIEYRSANGRAERFAELASELIGLHLDLILTRGTPAAQAAKRATGTVPVLMATMGDPRSIVASFAHDGTHGEAG